MAELRILREFARFVEHGLYWRGSVHVANIIRKKLRDERLELARALPFALNGEPSLQRHARWQISLRHRIQRARRSS
jgi:hypothetical protein